MMRRREFGRNVIGGAAATGGIAFAQPAHAQRRNTLMHVGGDYHSVAGPGITSKENLEYSLRHGVQHLTAQLKKRPDGGWDPDELKKMKDDCDRYGVQFEAIRMDADYITMRKGPDRDRELDIIAGNIQKASQVGVKIITYQDCHPDPAEHTNQGAGQCHLRRFQARGQLEGSARRQVR